MIANDLIEKKAYQEKPMRYEYSLKKSGKDLLPEVQSMSEWAEKYISGCRTLPDSFYKLTPADIA
jgi:DNA-binding HxlR family transcriptional regulator